MTHRLIVASLIVSLLSATAAIADSAAIVPAGSVTIEQAWIQLGDKDTIMQKAYVNLKSNANTPWILQRVTARGYRMVLIHRIVLQDGEPRMVLMDSLVVRPGDVLQMKKDGFHLMMMGPYRQYKKDDKIRVTFHFKDHKPIRVTMPVLKSAPKPDQPIH